VETYKHGPPRWPLMPPAVEVEGLAKRYGGTVALDQVSLTVEPETCVALLGPNGAGKSTLLEVLATLTRPTSGTARVHGHDVAEEPGAVRRRLGVAFQDAIAHRHLTAREVLVHHARLYGLPRARADGRASELLDFVGLTERADDRVDGFSGGMKRRLDLARVLTTDPDVLLLDEPTAGLDPRAREDLHERIAELRRSGTTVLLATHDLEEARRLATRVTILDRGKVVADDRPAELTRALGKRVVRVELGEDGEVEAVRQALPPGGAAVDAGDAVELRLDADADPSPGDVVDALDAAGLAYDRVTVRDPDLGDVFRERTGRGFGSAEEVPA